jgi:hypothetical protein
MWRVIPGERGPSVWEELDSDAQHWHVETRRHLSMGCVVDFVVIISKKILDV